MNSSRKSLPFLRAAGRFLAVHNWPFWAAALAVGAVAAAYAKLFILVEKLAQGMLAAHPLHFLVWAPLLFLASWSAVVFLAPDARGSGIPQVMASIEILEEKHPSAMLTPLIGLRTAVVKVASSLICVLGGGAAGREGPMLQIASAIFYATERRFERWTGKRLNPELWLVTGSAAGIAAAFNTPLGGLVFGIEELASTHFHDFRTSLIAAVIIAGMASQWISGPYLYLGVPTLSPAGADKVFWALSIGALCGFLGAAFGRLAAIGSTWAHKRSRIARAGIALACGFAVALFATGVSAESAGPGRRLLMDMLFTPGYHIRWDTMVARFFTPLLTYSSGVAGGVFAPALAMGGGIGQFLADCTGSPFSHLLVMLGMIGFLTGVTRAPFTAFVLVLEMTDRHSAILPMMVAALVAAQTARWVSPQSFYEDLKANFLPAHAPSADNGKIAP